MIFYQKLTPSTAESVTVRGPYIALRALYINHLSAHTAHRFQTKHCDVSMMQLAFLQEM